MVEDLLACMSFYIPALQKGKSGEVVKARVGLPKQVCVHNELQPTCAV